MPVPSFLYHSIDNLDPFRGLSLANRVLAASLHIINRSSDRCYRVPVLYNDPCYDDDKALAHHREQERRSCLALCLPDNRRADWTQLELKRSVQESDKRTQASACDFVLCTSEPLVRCRKRNQEVSSMVATKTTDRKRAQERRVELRFGMSCTPPSWRRFLIAGATVCYSIQTLAQKSHQQKKGEDEYDST